MDEQTLKNLYMILQEYIAIMNAVVGLKNSSSVSEAMEIMDWIEKELLNE